MKHHMSAWFALSAVVTGIVALPAEATAGATWIRTIDGATCSIQNSSDFVAYCGIPSDFFGGQEAISGNSVSLVETSFSATNSTSSEQYVAIFACNTHFDSDGGACGAPSLSYVPAKSTQVFEDVNIPSWPIDTSTGGTSSWDAFSVIFWAPSIPPGSVSLGGVGMLGGDSL